MRLKRVSSVIIIFAIATILPSTLKAQTVRLGSYLNEQKEDFVIFNKTYLAGAFDGLEAYNIEAEHKLFCLPPKLALRKEQMDDMVRRWSKEWQPKLPANDLENITIGDALLLALKETFPCQ